MEIQMLGIWFTSHLWIQKMNLKTRHAYVKVSFKNDTWQIIDLFWIFFALFGFAFFQHFCRKKNAQFCLWIICISSFFFVGPKVFSVSVNTWEGRLSCDNSPTGHLLPNQCSVWTGHLPSAFIGSSQLPYTALILLSLALHCDIQTVYFCKHTSNMIS